MKVKDDGPWRGYGPITLVTKDDVRKAYKARFGQEPKRIFKSGSIWLAGPVKLEEKNNDVP